MPACELLLLHALPLDGSMWAAQRNLIPGATHAPTLYGLGTTLSEWAAALLNRVQGRRMIIVGNSIGGSCALEIAARAPDRIAALVLIGAKAVHRPEPELYGRAVRMLRETGMEAAWQTYWGPLFSPAAAPRVVDAARRIAADLPIEDVLRGVTAFHTRASRDGTLRALSCPTLCVTGEHDTAPGLQAMRAQAAQAPNGRLLIVPDCGHYVPWEQPDALNRILISLIADVTGECDHAREAAHSGSGQLGAS